jgi:hypothetical protein
MKRIVPILLALAWLPALSAQEPQSPDAALSQLYPNFDPATQTASWDCAKALQTQLRDPKNWPCSWGSGKVAVSLVLAAQVWDGGKLFLVSSAHLASEKDFSCHACQPAIGMAVFTWQSSRWVLESANPVVGMYGSWGEPPDVTLFRVGPEKYGILLSKGDGGQGYSSSGGHLIIPIGKTVHQVWSIQDEQDNLGAVDTTDPYAPHVAYRSSAAFKFIPREDGSSASDYDYFDIEVISRGNDRQDYDHPLKPENWTEVYRFRDGKYRLLSHKDFTEAEKRKAKPSR